MDLLRAWGVGVLTYIAGSVISAMIAAGHTTVHTWSSTGGQVLWSGVPALIVAVVMTALSTILHPEPYRSRRGRHLVAVLTVPVVVDIVEVIYGVERGAAIASTVASIIAVMLGAVVTWQVVDVLRGQRAESEPGGTGYLYY